MALTFQYKAKNRSGQIMRGKIDAPNKLAAITMLRDNNFFVTDIYQVDPVLQLSKFLTEKKLSSKELSLFCRQFATLTGSGIPIVQSLLILAEQTGIKALRVALEDTIKNLEAGQTLSQSMSCHPRIFPILLVNMVAAGEISGSLDHVLDRLANYYEKSLEVTEKLKSATTYPLFVMIIALVAIASLFVFVLPAFTKVLIDLQAQVPITTRIIIKMGELFRNYWYVLMILILFVILWVKKYSSTSAGKNFFDGIMIQMPIYGKLIRHVQMIQFSRTLAILLGSGISLLVALGMIKNHANNIIFQQAIQQAENSLKEGNGLSRPLQNSKVFSPMVVRMIRVGEETGELEKLLHKIADYYEQEVFQTINRLSSLLEPVLICFVGGIVGLIMISILLPLVNIMDSLQ